MFALLFTLLIGAMFILLKRRVLSPLDAARRHCQQMAEGELHTPVLSGSKDEIGEMLGSLEQMRLSLVNIIAQVRDSSQSVAHAAEEIAAGNVDLGAYRRAGRVARRNCRQHGTADLDREAHLGEHRRGE